jgi:hypothetical protein
MADRGESLASRTGNTVRPCLKKKKKTDMLTNAYDPTTQEAEAGR